MREIKSIRAEIQSAAEDVGAHIHELPRERVDAILETITQRFTRGKREWPLWNVLRGFAFVDDPLAWTWLGEFLGDAPTLMLFNDIGEHDHFRGFHFAGGTQIVPVLKQCFGFEFYLTNDEVDYLICFNHHDILYAAGTAKPWLQAKLAREPMLGRRTPETPRMLESSALPKEVLDTGFELPDEYFHIFRLGVTNLDPWSFTTSDAESFQWWRRHHPDRLVVPFAYRRNDDHIALFVARDRVFPQGHILILDLSLSPGSPHELVAVLPSFEAWYKWAIDDMFETYHLEQEYISDLAQENGG